MTYDINYDKLPTDELRGAMQRYIEQGLDPGHFLTAVLRNDLVDAFGRADIYNERLLHDIVQWVYNEAPSNCWGSDEKVREWFASFRA